MRRFVLRKRALFDWINQLREGDRLIAYRLYTLLDQIRLSKKLPFVIALPLLVLPFVLFPAPAEAQTDLPLPHMFFQCFFACICYGTGFLILFFFIFGPMRSKWIRELQQMFFTQDASTVLNTLIQIDEDLESQTRSFLRPTYPKPTRRARRH